MESNLASPSSEIPWRSTVEMLNGCPATASLKSSEASPSLRKTVLLLDWWLIEAENSDVSRRLAVGGMAWTGQKASRVFSSSPILKRHDAWNLETEDGIMVKIEGVINRVRTHQNGFSIEDCRTFMTGFPFYWDTYFASRFSKEDTLTEYRKLSTSAPFGSSEVDTGKYFYDLVSRGLLKCLANSSSTALEECKAESRENPNADAVSIGDASMCEAATDKKEIIVSVEKHGTSSSKVDSVDYRSGEMVPENHLSEVKRVQDKHLEQENNIVDVLKSCSRGNSRLKGRLKSCLDLDHLSSSLGEADMCKDSSATFQGRRSSIRLRNLREKKGEPLAHDGLGNKAAKETSSTGRPDLHHKKKSVFACKAEVTSPGKMDCSELNLTMSQTTKSRTRLQSFKEKEIDYKSTVDSVTTVKNGSNTVGMIAHVDTSMGSGHILPVEGKKHKLSGRTRKNEIRKLERTPQACRTPLTRQRSEQLSITPSESLNLKRSRSGRLLVPVQAFWLNQRVIYDQDNKLIGVNMGRAESLSVAFSPPPRKK